MDRKLTPGEKHMIGTVFPAGTISLDKIRLVKEDYADLMVMSAHAYVMYDDQINFPNPGALFKCWYSDDFSKENNFFYRTLLIHEIAHIWQEQTKFPYDEDFDMFAIDEPFGATDINDHTKSHLDMYKQATPAGSFSVRGAHLQINKPLADFQAVMVNAYMTLRGPLNVDHVTSQSLSESWNKRRNYNHGVHDLSQTLFFEMNQEEQAEVIVDYFCLLNNRSPEMERYMVSTHQRPPIEIYRKIIPFLSHKH